MVDDRRVNRETEEERERINKNINDEREGEGRRGEEIGRTRDETKRGKNNKYKTNHLRKKWHAMERTCVFFV